MKKQFIYLLALASLTVVSCSNDETGNPVGKTPVTIKMTDAPVNYDAINLNIDEIEIITANGRETIDIEGEPFNILDYRNGKDTVIASHDVPSGMIQEIRLILEDDGNEVIIDGETFALTTPSGQSSGVKLKVQDELVPNVGYTLLLDFDAAKSIHTTGNGKYMLKPVIRAIPVATSGAITGKVTPLDALPHVFAINGQDTLGTLADSLGQFYFPGVTQGTYKVVIEPSNEAYQIKEIAPVEVTTGSVKDLGTIGLQ